MPLSRDELDVLRDTVLAGYTRDRALIDRAICHTNARIRAAAINASIRTGETSVETLQKLLLDPSPEVRLAVIRASISIPELDIYCLLELEADPQVLEAIIFSLGERKEYRAHTDLCKIAVSHTDPLCREAAIAALANLQMEESLETLIKASSDRAPVRRRVAIALSYFDNPLATKCLEMLSQDRDWQTKKIAKELLNIEAGAEI